MSQNMNLSMTPYTQAGAFVCSQYDVGRECQITLVDDSGNYTIPTGATITVMATKPSGLGFTETCTWTGSTVTFSTTDTMTNEFGRFPAELRITQGDTILGTTNFYFKVEKSPHPNDVIDDDVIIRQNLVARVTTLEGQMETVQSDITDVKADIEELQQGGGGLTEDVKVALLDCFEHVAWTTASGQTYYDALENALYPPADLVSISAVYTQSGTVYNIDTLDSLKADLVVTAHMSDSTTQTVTTYTLSGTLTAGTSSITVAYGGKTTTFTVTVTSAFVTYIEADGNSYINIGYDPDGDTKIEVDYMSLKDSGSTFQVPIGATSDNSTAANGMIFNFFISSANVPCAAVANQKTNSLNTDITLTNGSRNVYTLSNDDFAIDGISKGVPRTSTGDRSLDTNIGYPFYVFARNQANAQASAFSVGRIYYLKIYENDILVKHFKPAFNGTTYGLYEETSGTFYGNSGSGTITGA